MKKKVYFRCCRKYTFFIQQFRWKGLDKRRIAQLGLIFNVTNRCQAVKVDRTFYEELTDLKATLADGAAKFQEMLSWVAARD